MNLNESFCFSVCLGREGGALSTTQRRGFGGWRQRGSIFHCTVDHSILSWLIYSTDELRHSGTGLVDVYGLFLCNVRTQVNEHTHASSVVVALYSDIHNFFLILCLFGEGGRGHY